MEWMDLVIQTEHAEMERAMDVAIRFSEGGIYLEDYSDLEEQVWEIAHVDLIEEKLLEKSKKNVAIHLYFSEEEDRQQVIKEIEEALANAGITHQLSWSTLQQEDWENSWKRYYHPIDVGERLVVVPSWEECRSERVQLRLDPGMAFGTGGHETTFLCLEFLEKRIRGGEKMLDVGTGSGILAIAGLLLGAKEAWGVDIDPMCVKTARENAELNGVEAHLHIKKGDLADVEKQKYNIITANIIADVIIRLAGSVRELLAEGGTFVASGIILEREADVLKALREAGLEVYEIRHMGSWSLLEAGAQKEPNE